jgi:hypothetical protein
MSMSCADSRIGDGSGGQTGSQTSVPLDFRQNWRAAMSIVAAPQPSGRGAASIAALY